MTICRTSNPISRLLRRGHRASGTLLALALTLGLAAPVAAAEPEPEDADLDALDLEALDLETPDLEETDAGALDLDALGLEAQPAARSSATDRPWKLFAEAAVGSGRQRGGLGTRSLHRLTLDGRYQATWGNATRAVMSARLDSTGPADLFVDNPVLSVREAYLGWQFDEGQYQLDAGRINLRLGPAYGYNPTDFFRDNALRTITTVDPFTLRENRLGVVMLKGQRLWEGGSITVALAPKLESSRSTESISFDWGATNARSRGQVSLATRWSEAVSSQLIVYKEADSDARVGVNATALLSDSLVAHGEWSRSREAAVLARVAAAVPATEDANRAALGLTYTTTGRLSLTAEWQHNGFAVDRGQWQQALAGNPSFAGAYFLQAQALQDNAAREAWLLYLVQRDFLTENLELTMLLKDNRTDRSRLLWLDLRHRWTRVELALQLQHNQGAAASEFGIVPFRTSVGLVGTAYF